MNDEAVPSVATHYFVEGRSPFLNLSDLDAEELDRVIADLGRERSAGRSQRTFGRRYMDLRRQTEARLRELFAARGGVIQRTSPHYFVLGTCGWFEALSPDMASVEVAVDALPAASTSITYPDRVVAMRCGAAYGLPEGSADDEYGGYEFREFEKFVEVQVWTDDVLDLVAPAA